MKTIEETKQRTADARAEIAKLKSEHAKGSERVAQLEGQKVANKANAQAFRRASSALAEARDELERVGLLLEDAAAELASAERAEKAASFDAEAQESAEHARAALELSAAFSSACGAHLASFVQLKAAVDRADASLARVTKKAIEMGVPHDGGARLQLELARELFELAPKTTNLHYVLTGARDKQAIASLAKAMREKLGLAAPTEGLRYPLDAQVLDMLGGGYASRLAVLEAQGAVNPDAY
jgi:hypothetical protein